MLSQSIALPLALAASVASSAAAFKAPVLHDHHLASRHNSHHGKEHSRLARGLAASLDRRQPGRMQRKVRRGEGAMLLSVADNSTETSSSAPVSSLSAASGETYTSTAIWWLQDGWSGACGTPISADALQVALPLSLYPDASVKSSLCGTTVKVTAPSTGKSIDCVVVGASERNDYTSFTQSAFTALEGDLEAGELAISFTLADGSSAPVAASSSKTKEAPAAATTTTTSAAKEKATTAAATTTTTTEAPAAKTAAADAKDAAINLAQQKVTSASSSGDDSEEEDDWVCDEEDDSSSSSSAAAATTTQAPAAKSYDAPTAWVDRKTDAQKLAAAAPTTTSEWVAPSSSSSSSSTWTSSAPAQTSSSSSAASSDGVADTSGSLSLLSQAGIKGFLGSNTDSIISWYHTNSGQDSTNGNSWCGFVYTDAVPGFAPSLKTMLNNFGGDYEAAATAYCGLEAIVTLPSGKSATLYIADAFDDTWVRTPASIDVIYDSFTDLYGSATTNKNDVIQGASWKLTGNRNDKYKFKSTNSIS
ncbi:hypothetical protein JCM3774_001994 [Rhodotorula dairenensis]